MALTALLEGARKGGPQSVLARQVGVAQTTISAWERGASIPPNTRIPALAAALGIEAEQLAQLVARERKRLGRVRHGRSSAGRNTLRAGRKAGQP
jgi:transcriptional regulator with XRE-family HTH domain